MLPNKPTHSSIIVSMKPSVLWQSNRVSWSSVSVIFFACTHIWFGLRLRSQSLAKKKNPEHGTLYCLYLNTFLLWIILFFENHTFPLLSSAWNVIWQKELGVVLVPEVFSMFVIYLYQLWSWCSILHFTLLLKLCPVILQSSYWMFYSDLNGHQQVSRSKFQPFSGTHLQ